MDTLLQRSVSQVACGARHSVFLFTNGQVAAVGVNNRGQIGCGDTVDGICPKTVPDLPPISVIACFLFFCFLFVFFFNIFKKNKKEDYSSIK